MISCKNTRGLHEARGRTRADQDSWSYELRASFGALAQRSTCRTITTASITTHYSHPSLAAAPPLCFWLPAVLFQLGGTLLSLHWGSQLTNNPPLVAGRRPTALLQWRPASERLRLIRVPFIPNGPWPAMSHCRLLGVILVSEYCATQGCAQLRDRDPTDPGSEQDDGAQGITEQDPRARASRGEPGSAGRSRIPLRKHARDAGLAGVAGFGATQRLPGVDSVRITHYSTSAFSHRCQSTEIPASRSSAPRPSSCWTGPNPPAAPRWT